MANYFNYNYETNTLNYINPISLDYSNETTNYTNKFTNINQYQSLLSGNKKLLVLDLDETLVHSSFEPPERQSDFQFDKIFDGELKTIYVLIRPYAEQFLTELSNYYDIIIFTSSLQIYADTVINKLDRFNVIKAKLFRDDCILKDEVYLKDLKKFGKDLKDVVIIDNSPLSYELNQDNGIPIDTWYEDLSDRELLKMIPFLKYLSKVHDVRPVIKKVVNNFDDSLNYDLINQLINKRPIKNKVTTGNNLILKNNNINYNTNNNKKINNAIYPISNNYYTISNDLGEEYNNYSNSKLNNYLVKNTNNIRMNSAKNNRKKNRTFSHHMKNNSNDINFQPKYEALNLKEIDTNYYNNYNNNYYQNININYDNYDQLNTINNDYYLDYYNTPTNQSNQQFLFTSYDGNFNQGNINYFY